MTRPPTLGASPDGARAAQFTTVATDVWEPLQRYLRRRARPDDVDDIAAETLTVLWRRLDDVPPGSELPWSYSIARRTLANHRRGVARRRSLVDRLAGRGETRDASGDADPAASVLAEDPDLHAALARLSADDRELLTLWAWEQLSVSELAVALDAAPNTVSVRLRRARQRLADHLGRPDRLDGDAGGDPGDDTACHLDGDAGHTAGGHTEETPR